MTISNEELAELLYRALRAPIGVLLSTNDLARARARLYKVRGELGDERLARLQLRVWPEAEGQFVIVKGEERER